MFTNYRTLHLSNDYDCPGCGASVQAVCKDEADKEKYWFSCPNERDGCEFSPGNRTHWSNGMQTTKEEAEATFERIHG